MGMMVGDRSKSRGDGGSRGDRLVNLVRVEGGSGIKLVGVALIGIEVVLVGCNFELVRKGTDYLVGCDNNQWMKDYQEEMTYVLKKPNRAKRSTVKEPLDFILFLRSQSVGIWCEEVEAVLARGRLWRMKGDKG